MPGVWAGGDAEGRPQSPVVCIYSIRPIRLALQGGERQDPALDGINAHYRPFERWRYRAIGGGETYEFAHGILRRAVRA